MLLLVDLWIPLIVFKCFFFFQTDIGHGVEVEDQDLAKIKEKADGYRMIRTLGGIVFKKQLNSSIKEVNQDVVTICLGIDIIA